MYSGQTALQAIRHLRPQIDIELSSFKLEEKPVIAELRSKPY